MAVIRESRQFKIGPIGVARSSSAGEIVGQQVAQSANEMQQYFFGKAVEDATKAGIESAQALEAAEVIALDPETGRPKAYDGPKGMGRYAIKAYQNVLLSRFEQEISLELEDKSNELALQFRRNPEKYQEAMSNHIAEMSNVEESTVFKNEIIRIGNSLQNNQYRGLQSEAIARQEKNDALGYSNSRLENIRNIRDAYAAGDNALGAELISSGMQLDEDNVAAGIILPNGVAGNSRERTFAAAQGKFEAELRSVTKSGASVFELQAAINGIDSGDLSGLKENGFSETFEILTAQGATFTESFSNFATELLEDGLNQARLNSEIATRKRNSDNLDNLSTITAEYFDIISGSNSDVAGTVSEAIDNYNADLVKQLNAYESGEPESAIKSITSGSSARLESIKSGVINNLFDEANSVKDIINIQKYLANPTDNNLQNVNEEAQSLALTLNDMAKKSNNPQFLTDAISYAEGVSDEERFLEFERKTDNAISYNSYIKEMVSSEFFSANSVEAIEGINKAALAELNKTSLQSGDKEKFKSILKNKNSDAFVRLAFGSMTNPKAIEAAALYARDGTDPNNLVSPQRKAIIDKARDAFDDPSSYSASVERYSSGATRRYNLNVKLAADAKLVSDALRGVLGETTEADRINFGKIAKVPDDFYINSKYNDPEYAGLTALLEQTSFSIWPQSQVESINGFLNGSISEPEQVKRLLVTYAKSVESQTDQGMPIQSNGSKSLTGDQKALMDEALAFSQINNDPTALTVHMQKFKAAMANPVYKSEMNNYFENIDEDLKVKNARDFIGLKFPETLGNKNLYNRLLSKARIHYLKNVSGTGTETTDELVDALTADIKKNFVEDDRIITLSGSNKTLYPLSATATGNEQQFMDYIRSSLAQNSPNKEVDWNSVEFKLTPVGYNDEDGGMTYGVVIENETGGRDLQEVSMQLEPDTEEAVIIPAFFSTNEPMFAAATEKRLETAKQEQVDIATEEAAKPSKASVIAERTKLGRSIQDRLGFGVEYRNQIAQKKFTKQEAQDELKTIVDASKYESLNLITPAMLRAYKRIGEVPTQQSLITLNTMLQLAKADKNPLARELEVDVNAMISIINGIEN